MREVNSCDFCGERAAGTFEVIPPERDPTGEGRRMVLCGGCRDTLASVLEPLLDGAPARGDGPGEGQEPTTVVAEPGHESEPDAEKGSPARDEGAGADDANAAGAADSADSAIERALGDGSAGGATDGSPDGTDVEEVGGRPRSARRGTPRGYRKVMRFLENREFPMEREEAETLAAEAYGVDRETVSAAIDHAIKHDRLREASGDLRQ